MADWQWWLLLVVSLAWFAISGLFVYVQASLEYIEEHFSIPIPDVHRKGWIAVDALAFVAIITALSSLGL